METRRLSDTLSVAAQITEADLSAIAAAGFASIICNRPDGEGMDQPAFEHLAARASSLGLQSSFIPVVPGQYGADQIAAMAAAVAALPKPILAYCRSGSRSAQLWSLVEAATPAAPAVASAPAVAQAAVAAPAPPAAAPTAAPQPAAKPATAHDIVIIGGGSAGIAAAASLLARSRDLDIAIIEPADTHYYQPGWTMVGAGIFTAQSTARTMASVMPGAVTWIKAAVAGFEPGSDTVVLADGTRIGYRRLVVCPGLKLNWAGVEGLEATLGRNGVTSNYRYDLAPYTWQLVQELRSGPAIFTQPPMPIKCAGAPQKAMYLSADHWYRNGRLKDIDVRFYNAGGVLFGVADYIPALMDYVKRYDATLEFSHNLTAVDGPARKAWFTKTAPDGTKSTVESTFAMLHVCPPQQAPDFIRASPLADAAGWVDVDQGTLRHKAFANIYALGDAGSTPNAKTAAAARRQAPIVAHNLLADLQGRTDAARYDGYGSCPLTVERGKIVLAEFGYGGKLLPTFPLSVIDGKKPTRAAWALKARVLPPLYWNAMLKGREWLAKPRIE